MRGRPWLTESQGWSPGLGSESFPPAEQERGLPLAPPGLGRGHRMVPSPSLSLAPRTSCLREAPSFTLGFWGHQPCPRIQPSRPPPHGSWFAFKAEVCVTHLKISGHLTVETELLPATWLSGKGPKPVLVLALLRMPSPQDCPQPQAHPRRAGVSPRPGSSGHDCTRVQHCPPCSWSSRPGLMPERRLPRALSRSGLSQSWLGGSPWVPSFLAVPTPSLAHPEPGAGVGTTGFGKMPNLVLSTVALGPHAL